MERPCNWVRTLVAQIGICFGLYFAFHLGRPQKSLYTERSEIRPVDMYFMSVGGGVRPLNQQTNLLSQMEKVARAYKARFVVNVGELGEGDPLMQNASQLVPSMKVPWYTTRASKVHEEGGGYFLKRVNIIYGKTLDIIGVNTGLLQDALARPSNETENGQLQWLTKMLEASSGSWCIVVGFHPLLACEERDREMQANQISNTLLQAFIKFEVNAYISAQDCTRQGSISYIENPGSNVKEHYLSFPNGRPVFRRESFDGFLLHRVSSLELVTYFVTSDGEVVHRSVLQQRGKEVM